MFDTISQEELLNLAKGDAIPDDIHAVRMQMSQDQLRKLIHDARGAVRTFKYLGDKASEQDQNQRKAEMVKLYSEQLECLIQLANCLIEKPKDH